MPTLSPPDEEPAAEPGSPTEDPDWDLLSELDRLRSHNSGLSAEAERQNLIGQDYARAASEQRFRAEELERENAIAHTNVPFLEPRVAQAEERAIELDELAEALRSQRDRLQTYYEQQKDRADRAESAAAMREAAAKVEYAAALDKLRRPLQANAGKDYSRRPRCGGTSRSTT